MGSSLHNSVETFVDWGIFYSVCVWTGQGGTSALTVLLKCRQKHSLGGAYWVGHTHPTTAALKAVWVRVEEAFSTVWWPREKRSEGGHLLWIGGPGASLVDCQDVHLILVTSYLLGLFSDLPCEHARFTLWFFVLLTLIWLYWLTGRKTWSYLLIYFLYVFTNTPCLRFYQHSVLVSGCDVHPHSDDAQEADQGEDVPGCGTSQHRSELAEWVWDVAGWRRPNDGKLGC